MENEKISVEAVLEKFLIQKADLIVIKDDVKTIVEGAELIKSDFINKSIPFEFYLDTKKNFDFLIVYIDEVAMVFRLEHLKI